MRGSAMSCGTGKDLTDNAILGGRLTLRQPRRGHRVGHDAILLAAATPANPGEHAIDLGAGVGAAGLALAIRIPGLSVTLVEIDPQLAALAAGNIVRNHLADSAGAIALDVTAPARAFSAAGLAAGSAACVMMNPPFHDPARQQASPDAGRRLAHVAPADTLGAWVRTANRLLAPRGALTLIWRADGVGEALHALERGFGGIAVLPVHPRPGAAAIRVLVRAVKGSRAPLALLPSFVLADEAGRPSAECDAVLRHGGTLLPDDR